MRRRVGKLLSANFWLLLSRLNLSFWSSFRRRCLSDSKISFKSSISLRNRFSGYSDCVFHLLKISYVFISISVAVVIFVLFYWVLSSFMCSIGFTLVLFLFKVPYVFRVFAESARGAVKPQRTTNACLHMRRPLPEVQTVRRFRGVCSIAY